MHRFQLGQSVAATGLNVPPGPYRITRLLPLADGMPQYHAKRLVDNHQRAKVRSEQSWDDQVHRPLPRL